ncbi:MAG: hypothetical protein M3Y64_08620 [Gemmatimonadota bacterium]|nr:hypothetical protein [Gemmatimonadota bacterium]
MSALLARTEIVRLVNVTQELSVGVGLATASVRTLTNVSLSVCASELIVLSGSRGAGERALLAVIAGDRRGVTGQCCVAPQTQLRLMQISSGAALALTEEWQRSESQGAGPAARPLAERAQTAAAHELFLLDVLNQTELQNRPAHSRRSARVWNEYNRAALFAWVTNCRAQGGSVIIAAGASLGDALFNGAFMKLQPHWPTARATSTRAVREVRVVESSVRVIPMHSGRLAPSVQLSLHS